MICLIHMDISVKSQAKCTTFVSKLCRRHEGAGLITVALEVAAVLMAAFRYWNRSAIKMLDLSGMTTLGAIRAKPFFWSKWA